MRDRTGRDVELAPPDPERPAAAAPTAHPCDDACHCTSCIDPEIGVTTDDPHGW